MTSPLRRAALRWAAWAAFSRGSQTILRLGSRLVLARLLWPEAFGLFSLSVVVVAGAQVLCQLQFPVSVVQLRSVSPSVLATAHWTLTGLGAAGSLVLLVFAGPISGFLGHPAVAPLLQVSGFQLLLAGLSAMPRAWLWREMAFKQLATRRLLSDGAGAITAITAAVAGAGVWSLIIQELVADLVDILVLWPMVRWRPRLHWSAREFKDLLGSGSPLMGKTALDYVAEHGDRFLVGRVFGPEALGFYSLALRLAEALMEGIGGVFARVGFPAFSRMHEDIRRSRRGFLEATRFQALFAFPVAVAVGSLADQLVPLVLGEAWLDAIPFTQVLAARALLSSMLSLPRATLMGRGRQWLVALLSLLGVGAFALGWGLGLSWGPLGVAAGGACAAAVLLPVWLRALGGELPIGLADWARSLLPAAAGAAAMAVVILSLRWLVPGAPLGDGMLRLVSLLVAGAACYTLAVVAVLGEDLRRYAELFGRGAAGTPGPGDAAPGTPDERRPGI